MTKRTIKKILLCGVYSLIFIPVGAQIHIEDDAIFSIEKNGSLSIDGLILQPSTDMTISGVSIITSTTPITSPKSISRVYNFSSPINFAGTVGVKYSDFDLNGLSKSTLKITSRPTIESPFSTADNSVSNQIENIVSAIYTSPSNYSAITVTGQNSGALPVSLLSFTAFQEQRRNVVLEWTTTLETLFSHFDIERSENGKIWNKIGIIRSLGGSNNNQNYTFTDIETKISSIYYYRLKVVDIDHSYSYSNIESVSFETYPLSPFVYPNPSNEYLKIKGTDLDNIHSIEIFNSSGIRMLSFDQITEEGISIESLPVGIYIAYINRDKKNAIKRTVIKK